MSKHDNFMMKNLSLDELTPPFKAVDSISGEGLELRLAAKYYYAEARIPGYMFSLTLNNEKVGIVSVLIEEKHDLVREVGHIGVEIQREFYGLNLPLKATKALLPFFKDHGMHSILITCNKGNAAVRKACDDLTASYLDTIYIHDGTAQKDRFLFHL